MIKIHYHEEITSTMDEARALVMKGISEESVVVASRQTQGRGRRGRKWESIPGNLFMTYITLQKCPVAIAPQLSFVACVAIGEALLPLIPFGNSITYKWPNDLLLNGKKLSGILLETVEKPGTDQMAYLIGCGMNITGNPCKVRYPTTSLYEEGIHLTYQEVLQSILASFEYHLELWTKQGFSPIYDLWMQGAAYVEKIIQLDLQGKIEEGIFKGMNREGAMLLKTKQGLITVNAGEVLAEGRHASCN